MGRNKTNRMFFGTSGRATLSWWKYYQQLKAMAIASFTWKNMPKEIDVNYMEYLLFKHGYCAITYDSIAEQYVCGQVLERKNLGNYNEPVVYDLVTANGDRWRKLDKTNSVIIYNDVSRRGSWLVMREYAERLEQVETSIDMNVEQQRTPYLVRANQENRFSLTQVLKKLRAGEPEICVTQGFDEHAIGVLKTESPYVSDKMFDLKTKLWNEALTYIGVANVTAQKNERMITDEVERGMGGAFAMRESRLKPREQACTLLNDLYDLTVSVEFDAEGGGESRGNVHNDASGDSGAVPERTEPGQFEG